MKHISFFFKFYFVFVLELSGLATMLKREPPDGKEKPEPPKIGHKPETLSRKNSKSDLIERSAVGLSDHSGMGGGNGSDSASVAGLVAVSSAAGISAAHMKADKRDSAASKDMGQSSYLVDSMKTSQQSFLEPLKDDELERLKDW